MTFFLQMISEEDILKNIGNQTVLVSSDFHFVDKHHYAISQNIFF